LGCRIRERIRPREEEIEEDEDTHDLDPVFWYEEDGLVNKVPLRASCHEGSFPENKTSTPVAASKRALVSILALHSSAARLL
jgi:hypothetical protein